MYQKFICLAMAFNCSPEHKVLALMLAHGDFHHIM
jgi:hypothetical protein